MFRAHPHCVCAQCCYPTSPDTHARGAVLPKIHSSITRHFTLPSTASPGGHPSPLPIIPHLLFPGTMAFAQSFCACVLAGGATNHPLSCFCLVCTIGFQKGLSSQTPSLEPLQLLNTLRSHEPTYRTLSQFCSSSSRVKANQPPPTVRNLSGSAHSVPFFYVNLPQPHQAHSCTSSTEKWGRPFHWG